MLLKNDRTKNILFVVLALSAGLIIAYFFLFDNTAREWVTDTRQAPADPVAASPTTADGTTDSGAAVSGKDRENQPVGETVVTREIVQEQVIDYTDIDNSDKPVKELMISRKKALGLDKSLDMIVRSDESVKIGDHHVAMRDILEKAFLKQGDVFEQQITASGRISPEKIREYGIYVVQPGDNIWNIHFRIVKEYYRSKGIAVEPKADEPVESGLSSGIGKILKFSETQVIIYNLVEDKVDQNINLIQPLSKIVVYNMEEVFSLLQEINYENVDRIQFDGKTIWIPTENG